MHVQSWQVITLLVAVTSAAVLAELPAETWLTLGALSLCAGAAALVLMAAAALLGGRIRLVEALFGGLDRVYLVHKWLGIWALAFASLHFLFKANVEGWDTAAILGLPPFPTRLVRQASFIALTLIIILALNRRISYSTWRWWHKLSGPLFVIVILHWLSFRSPIKLASVAGSWLALMSALGVAAAAWKLLLYPALARHAAYRVTRAARGPAALELELEPVSEGLAFIPGQFAFLIVQEDGLREPHPFTIAGGSDARGHLSFVIRALGDYTQKLVDTVVPGMYVDVYLPYGGFRRRPGATREIWIGGGVGISPFISWLKDETASGFDAVTLFYFYTPGREFPPAAELAALTIQRGAEFVAVPDGPASPAFVNRFAELVREAGPATAEISFCGPRGLLSHVRALMRMHGVPRGKLHYEYFEFR